MDDQTIMAGAESEEAFLHRRAAEERRRMDETSCMVRSVHEELAEGYEERGHAARAEGDALRDLALSIR